MLRDARSPRALHGSRVPPRAVPHRHPASASPASISRSGPGAAGAAMCKNSARGKERTHKKRNNEQKRRRAEGANLSVMPTRKQSVSCPPEWLRDLYLTACRVPPENVGKSMSMIVAWMDLARRPKAMERQETCLSRSMCSSASQHATKAAAPKPV